MANLSQQRGRAMSSSIARALDWREREVLREELLRDPADWTHRARLAVEVGQRQWEEGLRRSP